MKAWALVKPMKVCTNCSNTLTQYVGKVDLLTQPEYGSGLDNLLKPLVIEMKKAYPTYDSPGKSNNSGPRLMRIHLVRNSTCAKFEKSPKIFT